MRVGEFADRTAEQVETLSGPEAEPSLHEALLASVPTPVLRSLRERLLGPLREYDNRHNAELMRTLKAFLACDGSWSACAARLYVHVNTVRYRINRIEVLTGRDLSALADRVDFFLALAEGAMAKTAIVSRPRPAHISRGDGLPYPREM